MRSGLVLALLAPMLANAADEGELTIGLAGGALITDELDPFDHGLTGMLRVAYAVRDGVEVELDLPVAMGVTRYQDHPYMGLTPRLNFRGQFTPSEDAEGKPIRLHPYMTAGPGVFVKTAKDPETLPKGFIQGDVDFLLNVGPGVLYEISDALSVRTDLRMVANFGTERFENSGDTFIDWEWTAGLGLSFGAKDTDGDGIKDKDDTCPAEAEDPDGFEDADGCPDLDNDADTVPDTLDTCPLEAEDIDRFQDEDGCPDLDNDADAIPDVDDRCPDTFGKASAAGCPDADEDGIRDANDVCPDVKGPKELGGCPDTDGDGILDKDDTCPAEAGVETAGGCPDADADRIPDSRDACPNEAADPRVDPARSNGCLARVFLGEKQLFVLDPISFPVNKATIARESNALLDQVAALLQEHTALDLEIRVHSDSAKDEPLTQKRAEALQKYLADKGVDKIRLVPKGMGASQPIPDAPSQERIEFVILAK